MSVKQNKVPVFFRRDSSGILSRVLALLLIIATLPAMAGEQPKQRLPDGCSMAPDFNVYHCCDAHDQSYWRGGSSALRAQVDLAFRQCIIDAGRPVIAGLYYNIVRITGHPALPLPWRWGFGWPWPRSYED